MDALIAFLENYVALSAEAKADIQRMAHEQDLEKGAVLLDEGYVCRKIYFLISGTVRTYFYQKGKDVTYWIYPEDTLFTSWPSFVNQKVSNEFMETTEPSRIAAISYTDWQKLSDTYPEINRFGKMWMEEQMAQLHEFYMGYYFMSAKEKFDLLVAAFPTVTQRANLGHIASMLGISQETLSRIRGK
jgi:CRP-like cAMP-binding protein